MSLRISSKRGSEGSTNTDFMAVGWACGQRESINWKSVAPLWHLKALSSGALWQKQEHLHSAICICTVQSGLKCNQQLHSAIWPVQPLHLSLCNSDVLFLLSIQLPCARGVAECIAYECNPRWCGSASTMSHHCRSQACNTAVQTSGSCVCSWQRPLGWL